MKKLILNSFQNTEAEKEKTIKFLEENTSYKHSEDTLHFSNYLWLIAVLEAVKQPNLFFCPLSLDNIYIDHSEDGIDLRNIICEMRDTDIEILKEKIQPEHLEPFLPMIDYMKEDTTIDCFDIVCDVNSIESILPAIINFKLGKQVTENTVYVEYFYAHKNLSGIYFILED